MGRHVQPGIVVDASVARYAGGEDRTVHVSLACTLFLKVMMECDLFLVQSPLIKEEWDRNRSEYSYRWRNKMIGKKRFKYITSDDLPEIESAVSEMQIDRPTARDALYEDRHLIAVAIQADNRIASCDENAREPAKQLAAYCPPVRDILWINPANHNETPLPWLQQGAPLEPQRLLGHVEGQ